MILILFLLNLFIKNTYSTILPKYKSFLKHKNIYNELTTISTDKLKTPIILNGNKTPFKKDYCKIFSEINNFTFDEYYFDNFIVDMPHLEYNNRILYIHDFLIGHGRIFNDYEKNILNSIIYNKNSNLIILHGDDIDNIPYKDVHLIKKFKTIEFPNIKKTDIIHHISDTILYNKYNDDLFLLNWNKYNIEILDIEGINILLFELNSMFNDKITINDIHKNINYLIEGLKIY
jgi:hypothetical protein